MALPSPPPSDDETSNGATSPVVSKDKKTDDSSDIPSDLKEKIMKLKQETELTPPPTEDEGAKEFKDKSKGKGKKGSKKASWPKKQAAKRRKVSESDAEAEDGDDSNVKLKNEDAAESKPEQKKSGRKKGETSEAWDEATDKALLDLIKKHTDGDINKSIPWKEVHTNYRVAFPESKRSQESLRLRWKNFLKHGQTELTDEEMDALKQAHSDINGSEKNAAIAWRYQQLTNTPINKTAVAKLLKKLSLN